MDLLTLYEKLPPTTLARVAAELNLSAASARARLRNLPLDVEAWSKVREVVSSLEEKSTAVGVEIETLLQSIETPANDERID